MFPAPVPNPMMQKLIILKVNIKLLKKLLRYYFKSQQIIIKKQNFVDQGWRIFSTDWLTIDI